MKADILAWQLEKAVTKINAHCLVQTDTKKQFQGCKLERECMIDKKLKKRRMSTAGRNGKENGFPKRIFLIKLGGKGFFYDVE